MKDQIKYRSGYKYQLADNYTLSIPIKLKKAIITKRIELFKDGWLVIWEGYCWDGPSGPVRDSKCKLRAALVHDALYQLIRCKKLSGKHRKKADEIFRDICIEDGVSKFRANIYYKALRAWGGHAADPKNKKKVQKAP